MIISLIIPTIGRISELNDFLNSVQDSSFDINSLEIIIVDQNPKGYLIDILSQYNQLSIIHIYSNKKGVSLNKNLGASISTGDILCFPDDDCLFYSDTLYNISTCVNNHPEVPFFVGSIYSRQNNKYLFRNWPNKDSQVTLYNSYFFSSSITMFIRKEYFIPFDENMGVGGKYGSCEDVDILYRILKNTNKSGFYSHLIQVDHPEPNISSMSLSKVYSYASGFGYFITKSCDFIKVMLLFLLLGKKTLQYLASLFTDSYQPNYFKYYFKGLFIGLTKQSN
jgi:glycosyltransferase involved in cell wall biosynthesis